MSDNNWHWQEPGMAWKGTGIYHITLVVPSRAPILGKLVIPDDDPKKAYVERTELGKGVIHALAQIPIRHSEIRLMQYCLMPDHLHAILYVSDSMKTSIRSVIRGFWQGVKKLGREKVLSIDPNTIRYNERNPLCGVAPVFTEQPFIRPMSRKGQMQTMIKYVQMNPQRLATKKLKPGYFYVQEHVEIGNRVYQAVGNVKLLQAARIEPVHVRSIWVKDAEEHGDAKALRDYKNGCVLAAREGAVMVSPFISEHERSVLDVLMQEKRPIIYIADNGFGKYYKPSAGLFEAVAEGRMLILSPWTFDPKKKSITRAECVEMNKMAEEICVK